MKIERLDIVPFRIPLHRPLGTAGRVVSARSGFVVRLQTDDGLAGVGEACPHPFAPPRLVRQMHGALVALRAMVTGADPSSDVFSFQVARLPVGPVRSALEMGVWDVRAQAAGLRLVDLLGGSRRTRVPVNALVQEREPAAAGRRAERLVESGFRCLKLKIIPDRLAAEEHRLSAIRATVGPEILLRLDFNAAFDAELAIAAIERLQGCDLDYVEQPVADLAGLAAVRRAVSVPIAADESVTGVTMVDAIAAAAAADVIVVKPALLGLGESRSVIQRALGHGLGVVVTSTLDTSIGVTAALHLAATLPDPVRPAGLATVELLAGDLVSRPLVAHDGHLDLPAGRGLGMGIDEDALAHWGCEPP